MYASAARQSTSQYYYYFLEVTEIMARGNEDLEGTGGKDNIRSYLETFLTR
jgi:hypothetical protein